MADLPIYGMVCRLTEQKGVHLLLPVLDKFLHHKVQVVIVGSGILPRSPAADPGATIPGPARLHQHL